MTITDYVAVNTAKLLKQAGFPQEFKLSYGNTLIATDDGPLCRPHLWDAMKWLREEKHIHVSANRKHWGSTGWTCILHDTDGKVAIAQQSLYEIRKDENGVPQEHDTIFPTYEAACDAGIATACKYLINNQ